MGKNITWSSLGWTEGDEFITFAFGDFNSKSFGEIKVGNKITTPASYILRTSDGDRYNIHLAPPMQDKTADVPGGDGQYYFGTTHKPKVFDISFAFDNLTKSQIQELKRTFNGKEMRELAFAEDCTYTTSNNTTTITDYRVYMAKVTSQPNIKALCFDTDDGEKYKGEGSIQFTAYWPYCRDNIQNSKGNVAATGRQTVTEITNISNSGDIPTHFVFSSTVSGISKIEWKNSNNEVLCTIQGTNIRTWNSKTGIIKDASKVISYTGDGLFSIPVGTGYKIYITHSQQTPAVNTFTL